MSNTAEKLAFIGKKGAELMFALCLAVLLSYQLFSFSLFGYERTEIKVGEHILKVWIAKTPRQLERGLSHVPFLMENEGMLFVLPKNQRPQFHMKGVSLPLNVASIDESGKILEIKKMNPRTDQLYVACEEIRYTIEVRQGWFRTHGVNEGDYVKFKQAGDFSLLAGGNSE